MRAGDYNANLLQLDAITPGNTKRSNKNETRNTNTVEHFLYLNGGMEEIREPQSSHSILRACLRPPTRVSLPSVLGLRLFQFLHCYLYLLSPPFCSGQVRSGLKPEAVRIFYFFGFFALCGWTWMTKRCKITESWSLVHDRTPSV